ncbi:MAG TPA: metallophosphoesterase [Alphaproteobacteria bacterium]|nr:metallophosphoesterase [Alphaproteobacteria bacterium]
MTRGRFAATFFTLAFGFAAIGKGVGATTQGSAAAYVLLGPSGSRIARVVTVAEKCPTLSADGRVIPMQLRSAPGAAPLRPTASKPEFTKPSAFPARICEATVPAKARHASIGGQPLPLPPEAIRRIVVIGDTGCRIKAADRAAQACNDPTAYPFATVAKAAAAWKPDIVLHVGDYLYRENACPDGVAGCAGSPWGYGLDSWRADFLDPAAPLLKAAPWIFVRGNHESCDRAGQGWQRLLDPYPLAANRTCDDPANDTVGNFADPYAVPLGDGSQIVVWDTAMAGNGPFPAGDPRRGVYLANIKSIAALAKGAAHTILTNHHPVLGMAVFRDKQGGTRIVPSNLSLIDPLTEADPALYPASIDLLLSGHIHVWEQSSFGGKLPSQIVAGFSGTQEDIVPLPETVPADFKTAGGVVPDAFSSWVDGFGFMTMERTDAANWKVEIHDVAGAVVNRCTIAGRVSKCEVAQVHAK